ncbi:hypothetical protein EDD86DRAFT_67185 [Gorgonomyces haynaldii]|nr:hypothetical protein EDD86DRAFT_67185 [Gorgonomyces haynaldii]
MRFLKSVQNRFNFDTYKLVRQLERQGLTRGQSVSVMRTINQFLADNSVDFTSQVISKEDMENQIYLYKSHLQKVRNELQVLRQNDSANLKADAEQILREIESHGQLFTELLGSLKSDVTMEMNNNKAEYKEKQGMSIDLKTHEIQHKLVLELSTLKTEIESMKVELTSYIVWMTLGALTLLMLIDTLVPTGKAKKQSMFPDFLFSSSQPRRD